MRIAVTGGAGFIGSHVVDHLADAGHDVVVIDGRPPCRSDVAHAKADITDLPGLERALRGCDVVFHLAAVADVNDAMARPVEAVDINVVGTAKVWEAARRCGLRRAVLASTVWVYGGAVGEEPLAEDAPMSMAATGHIYTGSKLASELVVHHYHQQYGVPFTILRYGIPYGPRMRDALVIPRFVTMALAGDKITLHGDGSQYRNYVYVEDLAAAHVLALGAKGENEVFNLEGTEKVTMRRLVDTIAGCPRAACRDLVPARASGRLCRSPSLGRQGGTNPRLVASHDVR